MKFAFAVLASAAVALAQAVGELAINNFPIEGVVAGQTYTLTYTAPDQTVPVTFLLKGGLANDLKTLATITESAIGGTYEWTVDASLPDGIDYAVEIIQGQYNNYMGPFPLTGGAARTATNSATTTTTAAPTTTASTGAPYGTGVPSSAPNGTGTVGTLSPTVSTPKPTSTNGSDDSPVPFEGAASSVSVSYMGVAAVFGLVALFA